jgi:3,4-dihydroxy 2-butanone 4-phosphate synthase/GTP cyclohydrolase II
MARLPQLLKVAEKFNLKLVSIEDLVSYRMQHDSLILKRADTEIQTRFGEFRLRAYQQTTNSQVHVALTKGTWNENEGVLTRINSSQINNDILGMLTGSNDGKNYLQSYLDDIFGLINKEGKGAVIFINQAQQSENLLARITELTEIQGQGEYHKVPPMKMDYKDFGIGAQILHDLRINKLKVITNSSQGPRVGITGYGLQIMEYVGY